MLKTVVLMTWGLKNVGVPTDETISFTPTLAEGKMIPPHTMGLKGAPVLKEETSILTEDKIATYKSVDLRNSWFR